jgi:predicted NUDIX family NTP pyrophosphohydrolase
VPKTSAGLLLYRGRGLALELLLVHPGGPFWAKRDEGAWSIPKGELVDEDDPAAAAAREFEEELGQPPPSGGWLELGQVVQSGGKRVVAWGAEGNLDVAAVVSNTFEMEWPPRSGRTERFPEVDRAGWFGPDEAIRKLVRAQGAFVERLVALAG